MVHPEYVDGRATDRRAADEDATIEPEMMAPFVPSRMIEPRHLAGRWVEAGEVRAFVDIAVVAREREVARNRASAMLAGDDMIDFERHPRPGLRQAAVFAAPGSSLAYQSFQRGIHACGARLMVLPKGQTCLGVHQVDKVADAKVGL